MRGESLVGSTGFVGSNLRASRPFEAEYHSTNVADAFGTSPDLLVYSGVPAAMYLANRNPEADLAVMKQARANIRAIAPKRLVLVSSIAVYPDSRLMTEADEPSSEGASAYGCNRRLLEQWVREDYPDATIVRLPALYGLNLKKNLLFDIIHPAPSMLAQDKFDWLCDVGGPYADFYEVGPDGFFSLKPDARRSDIDAWFARQDFNSLAFTDTRSRYQFYDLRLLRGDIDRALDEGWSTLNVATEPISTAEVLMAVNGSVRENHLCGVPFDYDMRSVHFSDANGEAGYMASRDEVISSIVSFVQDAREGVI